MAHRDVTHVLRAIMRGLLTVTLAELPSVGEFVPKTKGLLGAIQSRLCEQERGTT